ncbi:hypothetical protein DMENIID0001_036100 [Sergentomyia squamirostris]
MSNRNCTSKTSKQEVHNLDHLYCHKAENTTFIKSSTNSDLITIIKENKQLKSMLLLHLDLIQEQSDQLLTKEKQISSLRQENESLKLKIERMERRMHIKQSRSIYHHLPTVDTKVKNNGAPPKQHFRIEPAPSGIKCDNGLEDIKPDVSAITKKSPSDPLEKPSETNGLPSQKITLKKSESMENITPVVKQKQDIKIEIVEVQLTAVSETNEPSQKPDEAKSPSPEKVIEDAKAEKQAEICSNKRRLSEVSAVSTEQAKKAPKLTSMTTNKHYITRDWELMDTEEELGQIIEKRGDVEIILEVPSWREVESEEDEAIDKSMQSSSSPIEEIREESYMKRHLKFEIDERRRKKWDVQRIREQRTIERLKKRHYKTDNSCVGEERMTSCPISFFPNPTSIRFIQITEKLPVQAFGEQIPALSTTNFNLPWDRAPENVHVTLIDSVKGRQEEADKITSSMVFVQRSSGQKVHHKTSRKNISYKPATSAGTKR